MGENWEEKEFVKGILGMSPEARAGNKRGFKEKANELKSVGASLCIGVVKIGVGKYSVVSGLRQGTVSGERGVTRSCPSGPGPGEENSTGTLPKFRKRETSETGLLRD
jgi:hypothetical protein